MDYLLRSLSQHPSRWLLGLILVFLFFPGIDLHVAEFFYDTEFRGFPMRVEPMMELVRKGLPAILFGVLLYFIVLGIAGEVMKHTFLGITRRVMAYLLLSLAIGPGLIVNLLLKENWGRPRPSHLEQFGGHAPYVPPLMVSDYCDGNCSFASGHASMGFWVVAFAFLAPASWRKYAIAAAIVFGALVGFVRIAQGGHFVSDVVWAGLITVLVCWWLHKRIIEDGVKAAYPPSPKAGLENRSTGA